MSDDKQFDKRCSVCGDQEVFICGRADCPREGSVDKHGLVYRLHNWCNEVHGYPYDMLVEDAQGLMTEAAEALSAREPIDARTFIEAVSAMGFPKGWEHVAEEAERIRQLYVGEKP